MRRSSKPLPKDPNQLAHAIVRISTEEANEAEQLNKRSLISAYLSQIGRKGGLKGGKIRAERLSPKRRKEIAQKAAMKRWSRQK